jgi:hypothetical protein
MSSPEPQGTHANDIQTIQRRDFATQLDASGLILQAIDFPTKRRVKRCRSWRAQVLTPK